MRRDGDRLVEHFAAATQNVLICAPFIKAGVLTSLLKVIPSQVPVRVVTRWLPAEIAVGVSDLEVFDVVAARRGAQLDLLDRLHAKIYIADDVALVGSANLTGAALGWSDKPNLELLTTLAVTGEAIRQFLDQLTEARPASIEERDQIRNLAAELDVPKLNLVSDAATTAPAVVWLPRLAAPARLFQAYMPQTRDRVAESVLDAALSDLDALNIPAGLPEPAFRQAVADAFRRMPAVQRLLIAAANDLRDADGADIIRQMPVARDLDAEQQWLIVREWMTSFLGDCYEIAPASFVVRLKPGAGRT
ncbi:phospholipase D family protein [Diaphorobacter sp.]|uniref:phospholipase D family protein n=1 Tax=Diaphorobacter sp. TaxID=1934310 RepID=UPI003D0D9E4C